MKSNDALLANLYSKDKVSKIFYYEEPNRQLNTMPSMDFNAILLIHANIRPNLDFNAILNKTMTVQS